MQSNFDLSLKYVLLDEGGNDDDPQDHGGRTSRGITQREYDSWCSLKGRARGDVWHATQDDIKEIYHSQYWQPYCDALPTGLDYLFFDISVNAGRTEAVRQFQKALGVTADGMLGHVTMEQIKQQGTPEASELIERISDVRRAFYRHLKQFSRYGQGWLNRVDHAEQRAKAMDSNTEHHPVPAPADKPTAPANPSVPPEASGTATGGLIAVLTSFKDDLQNLASNIPNLNYVILGIAVVGFGYTIWALYKKNKVNQNV